MMYCCYLKNEMNECYKISSGKPLDEKEQLEAIKREVKSALFTEEKGKSERDIQELLPLIFRDGLYR